MSDTSSLATTLVGDVLEKLPKSDSPLEEPALVMTQIRNPETYVLVHIG